jgi:formylglycine-generating enzyme required for sulfatase activity
MNPRSLFPVALVATLVGSILSSPFQLQAQDSSFYRISAPSPTTITGISVHGTITWAIEQPGAIARIQKAAALGEANWMDFAQVPCTNPTTGFQVFTRALPAATVFVPGGVFQMGDPFNDTYSQEKPVHTVPLTLWHAMHP